ncbi:MAG: transposase, partial [Chloroflexota bacterium]
MEIEANIVEKSHTVNEIFREYGESYEKSRPMTKEQRRLMRDMIDCRSGALGGHVEQCDSCHKVHYRNHSCRNRSCPQCGGSARSEWLLGRSEELLNVPYFHVVFTIDHVWNPLMLINQQVCYNLFYETVNALLKEYGQRYLGGEVGFIAVLHTWGQQLNYHVHPSATLRTSLHCIMIGGALKAEGEFVTSRDEWLFPVEKLSADFRERYCLGLVKLHEASKLRFGKGCENEGIFAQMLVESLAKKWEVYIKPPFGKPETVLEYLSGYVNRIGISNARILDVSDGRVTFRYRDYRDDGVEKSLTLPVHQFMQRFLLHVLPAGFVRIRYYGLWHPNQRH